MFDKLASIVGVSRGKLRLACALLALALLGSAAKSEPPGKDLQGDPLPAGAVARLGTIRFRHDAVVSFAAFLPGDKSVICVCDDGSIRIWGFPSGKEIRHIAASPKASRLNAAALTADGNTIATSFSVAAGAKDEQEIRLHEVATGKETACLKVESGMINDLAFSPKGEQLTLRDADGTVRVWDWANDKVVAKFDSPVTRPSPSRSTGGFGGFRGDPIASRGFVAKKDVFVYASDGKSLMFYGLSQVPRFVECLSGKEYLAGVGHTEPIVSVWYTPDGKQLLTSERDGPVYRWDSAGSKEPVPVRLPTSPSGRMVISPDGRVGVDWPASTSRFGGGGFGPGGGWGGGPGAADEATLFDLDTRKVLGKIEFKAAVDLPVFSPDSKILAAKVSGRPKIELYEVSTVKLLRTLDSAIVPNPGGGGGGVGGGSSSGFRPCLVFSPDGKLLAFQKPNSPTEVTVFDVATGKELALMWLPVEQAGLDPANPLGGRQRGIVRQFIRALSPDGRCLVVFDGGAVTLYELATGQIRLTFGKQPEAGASAASADEGPMVAYSRDGRFLAYGGQDGIVHLCDAVTERGELAAFKGHTGTVTSVAFAPNGKTLVSASADATALIWDIEKFNKRGEAVKAPRAADLDKWWQALAGDDATKAAEAMAELTAATKEAVALIKEQVKPDVPLDKKQVENWLTQLNDEEFAVRAKAASELAMLDERLVPILDKALAADPPLESRQRLDELRDKLTSRVSKGDRLRVLRAMEVLEHIGTPDAKDILRGVADWAPGAPLTSQARASLDRLDRLAK